MTTFEWHHQLKYYICTPNHNPRRAIFLLTKLPEAQNHISLSYTSHNQPTRNFYRLIRPPCQVQWKSKNTKKITKDNTRLMLTTTTPPDKPLFLHSYNLFDTFSTLLFQDPLLSDTRKAATNNNQIIQRSSSNLTAWCCI